MSDAARRRALARHPDEETRYRGVSALDAADAGDRPLLLEALADPSWRVRSAAVERLAAAPGDPGLLAALADGLSGGATIGARDAAAAALARIGARAVGALVERLGDPDPDHRQAVASVLGAIADRRAVAPLTARLADADANVRAAAAEALGKIGGVAAADALRAAAESDDVTLRSTAVEALVRLQVSLAPAQVERFLQDRALRRAGYRLLGACEDPGALALLARGLVDPSRAVREAALTALGEQRARRSTEQLAAALRDARAAAEADPGLADAWASALAADEPTTVMGALAVLRAAGGPRHVAAMLRHADDDRYRVLVEEALDALPATAEARAALAEALPTLGLLARLAALAALARAGSPAALESIVREASDPEAYGQGEAIAALGRLRDARGVAPLAGLLGDDAPAVAGLACTALVSIAQAGDAARAAVVGALRERAGASPSAALFRALGAAGDPNDLATLRAGLRADVGGHRAAAAAAVAALARRGLLPEGAERELVPALSDPAWAVRAAAARAFVDVGAARAAGPRKRSLDAYALGALRAALRDEEPAVRAHAAEALGACGRVEDAGALAALAADGGAPAAVVVAALRALVALGAPPADLVARAAAHPDPEVVKEAVRAAARLPGAAGEALLRDAAASARWDVRQAAARAMVARGDPALARDAARLAVAEPDPLVARAFAEAARALGGR